MGDADTMPSLNALGETLPDSSPHAEQQRGEMVGRFVVLDALGTGGMGVVYAAYDPNLDRKVAIKVLGAEVMPTDEARIRMLREAQAMARIDHPNVLRVHEAGSLGDDVYIAMEFAGGGTLRRWLTASPRSVAEMLNVFVQAGRGLAAAHAAGLVHRDFKPDNVLLLPDGTARVTDFGIVGVVGEQPPARPSDLDKQLSDNTPLSQDLTRTGALMGTPAYMAPEQFQGGFVGPAADQFAFCVALYEALYRKRPFAGETFGDLCAKVVAGEVSPIPRDTDVPSRIGRALLRGLSLDQRQRYPSMEKLLADIVRETRPRKAVMIGAAAGAIAITAVLGVIALRSDDAECTGAEKRLAVAWNPARRAQLSQAFQTAQRPNAKGVLAHVLPIIDRWGESWQHAYVGACEDTRVRRVQSERLLDLRMQCLTRRLDEARATLDLLGAGGGDAVDNALEAVRALPSVTPCGDTSALTAAKQPPTADARVAVAGIRAKLDQARAQHKLGRYRAALELARPALASARQVEYRPALAEALLEVARLQAKLADRAAAESFAEAMHVAMSVGDNEVAVRAAAGRISALAERPARFPLADEIAKLADALVMQGAPSVEARVQLSNATALLLQNQGRRDEAKARYDHAYALAIAQLGPDAPATLTTVRGLGLLAGARHRYDEQRRWFELDLAAQQRIAGPDHPDVARALENIANTDAEQGKFAGAKELRERALAIRIAALGPDHPDIGASYNNLGGFYEMSGDHVTAKKYFEMSVANYRKAYGNDTVELTGPLDNLGAVLDEMGDRAGARARLEESRALLEKAYSPDDPRIAATLHKLGVLARSERRFDDSLALLQRAAKLIEKAYGPNDQAVVDYTAEQATTYTQMGKLPEAREVMSRSLSAIASVYGSDHPRMAIGLGNYGFLQLKLEDPKGALASFEKSREIFEAKTGKNQPYVAFTLIGAGQALIRLKREADAVPKLERALAIGTAAHIAPAQLAETHYYLAVALYANPATRKRARAEATAALALYEKARSKHDADVTRKWLRKH